MSAPPRTCPVCGRTLRNALDLLHHLGEHSPDERAAVSRRQVADLRDLLRRSRLDSLRLDLR